MTKLWGEEFDKILTQKNDKELLDKLSNPKTLSNSTNKKSKSLTIQDRLNVIRTNVENVLGHYNSSTLVIKTIEQLHDYITKSIENGLISIDTETNNSLDPITCKLMGLCIYTPGQKNAYVPVNHVNSNTLEKLDWQLTEIDIFNELSRLGNTKIITHNGKFDYQVIKCTCGYQMKIYWDTMIGAKMLDENERSAGLKQQYIDKINPEQEKYSIDHLFENIEYAYVDPDLFALYAATDSYMTFKLYEWQLHQFYRKDNERLLNVFKTVEMPIVEVTAEMELNGVVIDIEYAKRLSDKYHKKLDKIDKLIDAELCRYTDIIENWRKTDEANYHPKKKLGDGESKSKSEQLETPVNITSPTQLAILLYDVLKINIVDNKSPRGTGEDILDKIDLPLCKLILEKRGLLKLINTYIDKLPSIVNPKTGRLYAHFNQLGAGTGRFSSSDPNLQNIPSHEKSIRMMFRAQPGYVLTGSDFSQQEPRLMCTYADDKNMIEAYKNKRDLYATIASVVHKNDYWDNMEHYEDGSPNPSGKKRRSAIKSVILGILYGRGAASVAEQIGQSVEDAQKLIDNFYKAYPKIKKWIDYTQEFAKKNGYVEDLWGRRRRLPDIQLPKYEIIDTNQCKPNTFNPLLFADGRTLSVESNDVKTIKQQLSKVKSRKDFDNIKINAQRKGITIYENSSKISQAERQCVNARVQGGAATLTKMAMINIYNDEILRDLGFRMSICVHDEIIGECPKENADKVAERLTFVMIDAARKDVACPMKCDPTIEECWYESDYSDMLIEEFEKRIKSEDRQAVFEDMKEKYCETTEEKLKTILNFS